MNPPKSKVRKVSLNDKHKHEFPNIISAGESNTSRVKCTICMQVFSIANKGRADIIQHNNSSNHKYYENMRCSSSKITQFTRNLNTFGTEDQKLARSELVFSYHNVFHNFSLRSMDCTSKLIQTLYNKKFACARTKTSAIVNNVIFPYITKQLNEDLKATNFVSILSDASNHKATKLYPILVQYFNIKSGINTKLLNLSAVTGESSDLLTNHIFSKITERRIEQKINGLSADNTNLNFGGLTRRGTCNIFYKLKQKLGRDIVGVGCNAHIVSNSINMASGLLSVDVETILPKIYLYFKNYTVRTESLKSFCEEADVEYKKLLGYSTTRWLALADGVERVIQIYDPLKSYFMSQSNVPKIIQNFFENVCSPVYLKFVHNQAVMFKNVVLKLEKNCMSAVEAKFILKDLEDQLTERLERMYIPLIIRNEITVLEQSEPHFRNKFMSEIKLFYEKSLNYIQEWTKPLEELDCFSWTLLRTRLNWNDIVLCCDFLNGKVKVNDGILIEEIRKINLYATNEKILEWNKSSLDCDKRWIEIFKHLGEECITYDEILKLIEFSFSLPGTNAPVERVFSLINDIWTTAKTQITLKSIEAQVFIKNNTSKSCLEFYKEIENNNDLLKQVHHTEKYKN